MAWRKPGIMGIATPRFHRLPILPGIPGRRCSHEPPQQNQLPKFRADARNKAEDFTTECGTMSMFSFFRRRKPRKRPGSQTRIAKAQLHVEPLEDRYLPSATSISGFVFADANNNGIYDSGETPIANAPVELHDAGGNMLGATTTDATGSYVFNQDATINQAPLTITKTLSFPSTQTDFTLPGSVTQFDPSLGQLQSVQITHDGSITSDIRVENTSTVSASTISGTVG